MEKSWKNELQQYCQKNKLRLPNYRIREQLDTPNGIYFQVEVEVNGRWYIGQENCSSKKSAEQSAAQKACVDLIDNHSESVSQEESQAVPVDTDNDPSRHLPREYADVEEYIATMVTAFGGRIRKVRVLDGHGKYKIEITGNYRYCENVKRQHKKNQVYFVVDVIKRVYYQRCHDPDCQGFQSARQPIHTNQNLSKQQATCPTSEYLGT